MTVTPQPPQAGFNLVGRVWRTVRADAARAGVELVTIQDMEPLHAISALFSQVWGRTAEGAPLHSEAMRSMMHAGGLVNAAYDTASGELVGAAALGRDEPGRCYGYLAAVRPGLGDRGIGRALKQHQRAWALERDVDVVSWTFDPLVARNARFNLSRLGAVVREYEPAFYGQMADALNGTDLGDRLVARWELRSARALAAGEGVLTEPVDDPPAQAGADAAVTAGPDGRPALVVTEDDRWIRVPADIVGLRTTDPTAAQDWRARTCTWLQEAFAAGLVAHAVSRTGWYHLSTHPSGAAA